MIRATEADRPAIEAFLHRHIATAMFPLSNLNSHGMAGGHPRAMRFWLRWCNGQVTDVLSVSEEGIIFPNCPTGPWSDVAVMLAGYRVKGLIGAEAQVASCRAALGLTASAKLEVVEPHYTLSLDNLRLPDPAGYHLVPLTEDAQDLCVRWRTAFCEESMACTPDEAAERAVIDIAHYLEHDTHRVLMKGEEPLAMTGFNAMLPQVVQIGGVYTPPDLRSRGYARLAVALHLAEARARGVTKAILSAANVAAARAYEAIGFERCGSLAIAIYDEPQVARV